MDMKHKWKYCSWCDKMTVVCSMCGNNCCNAGSGEVDGEPCPECDNAYEQLKEAHKDGTVPDKPIDWEEQHKETHRKFKERFGAKTNERRTTIQPKEEE